MTAKGASRIQLDDSLVGEIRRGFVQTLSNMFGVEPVAQPHSITPLEKGCVTEGEVTGSVNLIQDQIEGVMLVSFPSETILPILSVLFQKPHESIDKSVVAAVGELTNSAFGVMKTNLNRTGFQLRMSIPNVIVGKHRTIARGTNAVTLLVPFSTKYGPFFVTVALYRVN